MKELSMIVAMAKNRAIGKDNQLLWRLKSDLQHFKAQTLGKALVMGRKTYESIGRPLPGRRNIVLTRDPNFQAEGIEVVHSMDDVLNLDADDIVIGGGEQVYQLFLPHVKKLILTNVDTTLEGDAFFPEVDDSWIPIARESHEADADNEYGYEFVELIRII